MGIFAWFLSRCRELRGLFQRILWLRWHYFRLLLTLVSAFFVFSFFSLSGQSFAEQAFQMKNYSYATEAIALLVVVFSVINGWALMHTDVVFERLNNITSLPKPSVLYDKNITHGNQAIIFNSQVNLSLESGQNPLKLNSEKFQVHPLIHDYLPMFIFKMPEAKIDTSDDKKVRLNSDLFIEFLKTNQTINLQETSYFKDRLSNTLANYKIKKNGRLLLDLRSTEVLNSDGYYYDLRESKLSNQLGGSVILITSDSAVVVLRQGNRTSENAGLLAPTGSGSFDYVSRKNIEKTTFQEYARQQTKRELCEETGLPDEAICDIQICGFGRYLYRNGKPEVFCIATTHKSSNEISPPLGEWDYQQKVPEIIAFTGLPNKQNTINGLKKLIKYIDDKENGFENCSGPLYWNTLFAIDYLEQLEQSYVDRLFAL